MIARAMGAIGAAIDNTCRRALRRWLGLHVPPIAIRLHPR